MSLLSQIIESQEVQETEEYVASGSKRIEVSGNHIAKILMAKEVESSGGAIGIEMIFETEDGKKVYNTMYVTNKEKNTFYITKDGDKKELPGFAQAKGLNFLLNGVWGLPASEPREIKEYDSNVRKEVSKVRNVILSWLNRPIGISVQVVLEDHYNDSSKPVTKVNISHYFDPVTNQFGSEKRAGKPAEMHEQFAIRAEAVPVEDKRVYSKGASTTAPATEVKKDLAF